MDNDRLSDADRILASCIRKQTELSGDAVWQKELIPIAPPVLWFGDVDSKKPKIVTVGANPSRREFWQGRDHHVPLGRPRFFTLERTENSEADEQTRRLKVIPSFNTYFDGSPASNPYRTWFGKVDGGKVEGFINGMGGSFYGNSRKGIVYTGVHVDLFPYATVSDFSKPPLHEVVQRDLFETGWANQTLQQIVCSIVRPKALVVCGKGNVESFNRYFGGLQEIDHRAVFEHVDRTGTSRRVEWETGTWHGWLRAATVKLNLGDPRGFNTEALNRFGRELGQFLGV